MFGFSQFSNHLGSFHSEKRERDQPRMLKNHLSFIEPRNYSTENMDHIMDGKCAVSDSEALSFYQVEHLYKDLYKTSDFCFIELSINDLRNMI